jgi:membrane-associated protease RseP (regulator of RpoE activity)
LSNQTEQPTITFEQNDRAPVKVSDFLPTSGKNKPSVKTLLKHLTLFLLTVITVSTVSTFLVGKDLQTTMALGFPLPYPSYDDLMTSLLFAGLLLGFLTFHEFGHYFAAVYHNVAVSLPYYIPLPLGIGTLGAVIRIREPIKTTRKMFDIGAAGPIAGFVVSLIILFIGFATLPEPEFLNQFGDHNYMIEHFEQTGEYPAAPEVGEGQMVFFFGGTLLFNFFSSLFADAPPLWEIMHYPFLLAGWFGLFFTALNLMPVGQLDGGHILYTLIGYKKHRIVARVFFIGITLLAGIEAISVIVSILGNSIVSIVSKFRGEEYIPIITQYLNDHFMELTIAAWGIWIISLFLIFQKAFYKESKWVFSGLITSISGAAIYLYFMVEESGTEGSLIWLFWVFFITFFVKVEHPPVLIEEPLSPTRKVLGWLSMCIFVLCISFNPLSFQ